MQLSDNANLMDVAVLILKLYPLEEKNLLFFGHTVYSTALS